ncbi:hypothetical protein [Chryseobacterium sp.]|uniref:hypothetical protein n=1 Tax=Chryseobacterium sp. TaxID=1871047 RepID=UPI00289EB5C5|nr:hypothetical protein [Chryseobacterium sp.]
MKAVSVKQAYSKVFKKFEFTDLWLKAFGSPEKGGLWYLGGGEKNGKSTFALMLAKYLTKFEKVLYISAEEGISDAMVNAMKFAGISDSERNFHIVDYEPWEDIQERLSSRYCQKIVFIDNATMYRDEVTKKMVSELKQKHSNKLIILICHEEKGVPDNAIASHWRKLSKIIIQAEGLKALISGRCPGGQLNINEEKAQLYWGT